eukprot:10538825-Alexandrium_andersonii.AAC.1
MAAPSKSGQAMTKEVGETEGRAADRPPPPRGRLGAEVAQHNSPYYCGALARKEPKEGGEAA